MSLPLLRKLLFDLRWAWLGTIVLLVTFEAIWVKITERFALEVIPALLSKMSLRDLMNIVFDGSGKFVQTLLGGESINLTRADDILSIGYVHPLPLTLLALWSVTRAGHALAGELERGTLELLLAQPLARWRIVGTHLLVDLLTLPVLAGSLLLGSWLGLQFFPALEVQLTLSGHGLACLNAAALAFALSGMTMALSAVGRTRGRVLLIATALVLVQFLVNALGQLWDGLAPWRPATLYYYYQPQPIILQGRATVTVAGLAVPVVPVLLSAGLVGYLLAWWDFCHRDLPAPL